MKIVFTGGGTGGHILPIIAIVRELKSTYKDTDLELFYMGPEDKFGDVLLSQEGVQTFNVPAGKLRRYWGFAAFFGKAEVMVRFKRTEWEWSDPVAALTSWACVSFLVWSGTDWSSKRCKTWPSVLNASS